MPNKLHGTRSPGKTANSLYRTPRKYAVLLPKETWVGKLYYNLFLLPIEGVQKSYYCFNRWQGITVMGYSVFEGVGVVSSGYR